MGMNVETSSFVKMVGCTAITKKDTEPYSFEMVKAIFKMLPVL